MNGMFICRCQRCLDPTELGTFVGAIKCQSCTLGYMLPIDPVDSFSSWKCGICDEMLDDESIVEIIHDAEMTCGYTKIDLGTDPPLPEGAKRLGPKNGEDEQDEILELLKEFEQEYSGSVLHPNHYILQEVNVRIIKRQYKIGFRSLKNTDLVQYLDRCEKLLKISNILTPGFCEYRAFLQYHFSQGLLALERRKVTTDKGGPSSTTGGGGDSDQSISEDSMEICISKSAYRNSLENYEKLVEMLTFLITFFKEINPSHKLLQPISDTLIEAEKQVEILKEKGK